MTSAREIWYRIGGHLLTIRAAGDIDVEQMLPSFAPFRVEADGEPPVLRVIVDNDYEMGTPQREVGQFDCGGCIQGVFLMPDGGYQFHIRNVEGDVCSIMQIGRAHV